MPLEYPPKPERLNAYEREVVVNMLNSLSRNRTLPQIAPRCGCMDRLRGRLPFQGYGSACCGRHYCLRGMDCCGTAEPSAERHLRPLCPELPTVRFAGISPPRPGSTHKSAPALGVLPGSVAVPASCLTLTLLFPCPGPHRLLPACRAPGHKRTAKTENQHEGSSQVLSPVLFNRAHGQHDKCLCSGDSAKTV